MSDFIISAFADEIDASLDKQIRVLKECNIHFLELRSIDGKNVSDFSIEDAKKYKKRLDDEGIKVSSIGSPIGKINIKDEFELHLKKFEHVLKIASVFESPYVRMFSFFIDKDENPDDFEDKVINRWNKFMKIASHYPEITLLHENEKEIYGDIAERCLNLVTKINNPQLQLAFDPANFVQCGVEVYPKVFELLKEHIGYLHIKDARFADGIVTPVGMGDGNVLNVLKMLVKSGFNGFASIEPHLTEFDGYKYLEHGNVSIANNPEDVDGETQFKIANKALIDLLAEV